MSIRNPVVTFSGDCEECGKSMQRTTTKAEAGNIADGIRVFCRACRAINNLSPDDEVHGNARGETA